MSIWPIERRWSCTDADSPQPTGLLTTAELADMPLVALLGSAGSGKTFELGQLMELERQCGKDVRHGRMAMLAADGRGLSTELTKLVEGATSDTTIYLDSLDESLIADRFSALTLSQWIRSLTGPLPSLRIACRSAVWAGEVLLAARATYGGSQTRMAALQPLDEQAVRSAATAMGVDGDAFWTEVVRSGALSLSQHPLTLKMLLQVFRVSNVLPPGRNALFAQGIRRLVEERDERRRVRTAITVPTDELLVVAKWLACFVLLSGHEVIDFNDETIPGTLSISEITGLSSFNALLTHERIEALAATGLCESDGDRRFRFGHRQFAEYLAGTQIGSLLTHQARSLLESGLGWTHGVASPLRETAAFAAASNPGLAEWITDYEPTLIALSDAADDTRRRRATFSLLRRFRAHEITDSQVLRKGEEYLGLKYAGAASDLEPVLRERGRGSEDVLEFAINLAREWKLSELSDALADLMLDPAAPEHPRVSAGYALTEIGTPEARQRLKVLVTSTDSDPHLQLRALALRCNWPGNLTVAELLAALEPRTGPSFTGAYEGFLYELEKEGFQADGDRPAGLRWAAGHVRRGEDYDPAVRIAKRIARAALGDISDPEVRRLLADLLLRASRAHRDSPLGGIRRQRYSESGVVDVQDEPPLKGQLVTRRALLSEMVSQATPDDYWWSAGQDTPHLLEVEDFSWLMDRALDQSISDAQRAHYAELARLVFRRDDADSIERWLSVRDQEPIRSVFNFPLVMELDSKAAKDAKKYWQTQQQTQKPKRPPKLAPPPHERVQDLLTRCETKDFRFFHALCQNLTLEEESTHFGPERFLTHTPGWAAANESTRARIVAAAEQFLDKEIETPAEAAKSPLNTVHTSGMAAYWLIGELHPEWLASRASDWWARWCWYFLRELHPNLHGEGNEPKVKAVTTLLTRAANEVAAQMQLLAKDADTQSRNLFQSLLDLFALTSDTQLDELLIPLMERGEVSPDRAGNAANYILRNGDEQATATCLSQLKKVADEPNPSELHPAVTLAVALLSNADEPYWNQVLEVLDSRPALRHLALAMYAHSEWFTRRINGEENARSIPTSRLTALIRPLFLAFPPEGDPIREGAYSVGPDDSGRDLRNQVLQALGDGADQASVAALKKLEQEFGSRYPWLRRPRARAEREYRQSRWNAVPPESVSRVLSNGNARLIRTPRDALDGIVEAIRQYETSLRNASPSPLEDLWNTPTRKVPSPKLEERASDKLLEAVRNYFNAHAVTAAREVQIYRRLVAGLAGNPGSRVDVFVSIPAIGTQTGDPIDVPIEVKRSANEEALTHLKTQLVDRYMSQSGADVGVYVVMWFDAPNLESEFTPQWSSIEEARADVEAQAEAASSGTELMVKAIVVDCSLP